MKAAVALALALAVVLTALPTAVHAGGQPHMIFALVGVGRGQTARLNISNIANADSTGRGATCEVEMGFVGGNNQMLVPAVRVALAAGGSTHLDVSVGNPDLIGNPDLRQGLNMRARPVVAVVPAASGACDSVVGSAEIFSNRTGATQAIVSPLVYVGFNPQPDIPGFVGVSGGQ